MANGIISTPKKNFLEVIDLNMSTIAFILLISLVIFQAIGLVFAKPLGIEIALGPVFMLVLVAISSLLGITIYRKLIKGEMVSSKDLYAVVVITVLAILVLLFLRDLVPEIFRQSFVDLQRTVGLG